MQHPPGFLEVSSFQDDTRRDDFFRKEKCGRYKNGRTRGRKCREVWEVKLVGGGKSSWNKLQEPWPLVATGWDFLQQQLGQRNSDRYCFFLTTPGRSGVWRFFACPSAWERPVWSLPEFPAGDVAKTRAQWISLKPTRYQIAPTKLHRFFYSGELVLC